MTKRARAIVFMMLLVAASIQVSFSGNFHRDWRVNHTPGAVPESAWLRLVSLGETRFVATALVLFIQGFDTQAGKVLALRSLDMKAIHRYLMRAAEFAPTATYPLFLASRIYANMASPSDSRQLLDWVERQYPTAPESHWPWLASAVHLAKHRLNDLRLARQYAHTLRDHGASLSIPAWALDLEFFLLADLNEFEAARSLLGGLIASGKITDQRAMAVMLRDLERLRADSATNQPEQSDQRSKPADNNADK